jgi:hypothetical protein
MNPHATDQPPTEEAMLGVASMFLVGLGIIVFVFFPLLLPGIAVLALFAVPLAPLVVPAVLIWAVFAVARFVLRIARGRAGRRAARTQPRLSP